MPASPRASKAAVARQLAAPAARQHRRRQLGDVRRHDRRCARSTRRRRWPTASPPSTSRSRPRDPEQLAARIRNAGAIFLGAHTPEVIGDYVAGSNHVLPTARSARFSSGLGVLDFMKRTSILRSTRRALAGLAPAAMTLARAEGLDAHRRSVAIRLGAGDDEGVRARTCSSRRSRSQLQGAAHRHHARRGLDPARQLQHRARARGRHLRHPGGQRFALDGRDDGPYTLNLSIVEDRLVFAVGQEASDDTFTVVLSLTPLRRIMKDYFIVCESYYQAIRTAPPSRIQAIDMGRRALHDEGSRVLVERLKGKITVDRDTARRLFTLICALHWKG